MMIYVLFMMGQAQPKSPGLGPGQSRGGRGSQGRQRQLGESREEEDL
jgi:hypothetical protein